MLQLIIGDAGSGKTTMVISRIQASLAAGKEICLIVPEQETVACERLLAESLPPSAPLSFEVTNFTRLSDIIFRKTGGLAGTVISTAGEQILLWRTLSELGPLLHTMRDRPDAGTVERIHGVMLELRRAGISPAMLESAARLVKDQALADKLSDYALITSTYRSLLGEAYTNGAERLDRLAEMLLRHRPLDGYDVYLDGFISFTEPQYAVIAALLTQANLSATLTIPERANEQLSATDALRTLERLTRMAREQCIPCARTTCEGRHRLASSALDYVAPRLFLASINEAEPWNGAPSDSLRLVEAGDPIEASDFVAADILRSVTRGDAHFRDCTVICEASAYRHIIDAALQKCGIPYFFAARETLLSLEPVKLLLAALATVVGGWRSEDVITYLKCPLSGVAAGDADAIGLYVDVWQLDGADWKRDAAWRRSPDGYGTPHTRARAEYNNALLARIAAARSVFMPPLCRLEENLLARRDTRSRIRALTEFLLSISLPDALDRRAETLRAAGDPASAAEAERIWDVICDTFDTLSTLAPDSTWSAAEFGELLRMTFRTVTMGQIPATSDEVTIADPATVRSESTKYAYLLGVNEGVFPKNISEGHSFTEQERAILLEVGGFATEAADQLASRELFAFYRALLLASHGVTVIWSRTNTAQSPLTPADAVLRLRRLLGDDYPVLRPDLAADPAYLLTPALARERLGQMAGTALGEAASITLGYGEVDSLPSFENADLSLTADGAARQYPGDLHLTQSRIKTYLDCPTSDFCSGVLRLHRHERATFQSASTGTFLHAILEKFLRLANERGHDLCAIPPDQQERLLDEVFPLAVSETLPQDATEDPRIAHQLRRLKAISSAVVARLCTDLSHTGFIPVFEEVRITSENDGGPAPYTIQAADGRNIHIFGTIDRVDAYRDGEDVYVRVCDYKTGEKKFDEEKTIEDGDYQLILYLTALVHTQSASFREHLGVGENGRILPAGFLYFSSLTQGASTQEEDAESADATLTAAFEESGLYFDDPAVNGAIDDRPEIYSAIQKKRLVPMPRLLALVEQAETELRALAADMTGGLLRANPSQDSRKCDYCPFTAFCRVQASDKDEHDEEI